VEINRQIALDVAETSQVSETRRISTALAHRLGFSETAIGKVALVVTECATNLIKHTKHGGQVLLQAATPVDNIDNPGIEIIALDKGNGMSDVARCLQDGYSTAGSPGTGLGAIVRLANDFDIYSQPGMGTALLARIWNVPISRLAHSQLINIGVVLLPKPGEEVCGDAWAFHEEAGRCLIMVADGLGHGLGAAEASLAAVKTFHAHSRLSPQEMLGVIHSALQKTRGAVVFIAEIDNQKHVIHYAGIGNIAGRIYTHDTMHGLISHNGTVGYQMGNIHSYTYPYDDESLIVLHSDGCSSQLNLTPYAGLSARDPAIIAAVLYRDFRRDRDDVTVLVAKMQNLQGKSGS
jgi:anti-sigma regulatory factor (Ser/Thr protein kinase)